MYQDSETICYLVLIWHSPLLSHLNLFSFTVYLLLFLLNLTKKFCDGNIIIEWEKYNVFLKKIIGFFFWESNWGKITSVTYL